MCSTWTESHTDSAEWDGDGELTQNNLHRTRQDLHPGRYCSPGTVLDVDTWGQ